MSPKVLKEPPVKSAFHLFKSMGISKVQKVHFMPMKKARPNEVKRGDALHILSGEANAIRMCLLIHLKSVNKYLISSFKPLIP